MPPKRSITETSLPSPATSSRKKKTTAKPISPPKSVPPARRTGRDTDYVPDSDDDDVPMIDITNTPNQSPGKRAGTSKKPKGKRSTEDSNTKPPKLRGDTLGSICQVLMDISIQEVQARNHQIAQQVVMREAEEAKQRTMQETANFLTRVENSLATIDDQDIRSEFIKILIGQTHERILKQEAENQKLKAIVKEKEAYLIQLENDLLKATKKLEENKKEDKSKKAAAAMAIFNAGVN